MHVIKVRNVNEAFSDGLAYLLAHGVKEESRAGPVLVSPVPVTTVYSRPQERVLFSPARNANPFFHIFESLFYLAGRNDAKWLDQFVHDFSSRFAEEGGKLHGSYGFRWRRHFDIEGGGRLALPDQLNALVDLLQRNPEDRQAVLTMWDPVADLGVPGLRDRPCNTHAYLRVRKSGLTGFAVHPECMRGSQDAYYVLDITVCCRSNDLWWGAYGANAVQFSVLQEYLAARIGVGIGTYTQISNNYHLYCDMLSGATKVLEEEGDPRDDVHYPEIVEMASNPQAFDADLQRFMAWTQLEEPDQKPQQYLNSWFHLTAEPLYIAHLMWKRKERDFALEIIDCADEMAPDWRLAAQQWFQRRMKSDQSVRTSRVV